jgi:hypothetical protein
MAIVPRKFILAQLQGDRPNMERHLSVNPGFIDAAGSGLRAELVKHVRELPLTNSLR